MNSKINLENENYNNIKKGTIASYNGRKFLVIKVDKNFAYCYLIKKNNFNYLNRRIASSIDFTTLRKIPLKFLKTKNFEIEEDLFRQINLLKSEIDKPTEIKKRDIISYKKQYFLVNSTNDDIINAYLINAENIFDIFNKKITDIVDVLRPVQFNKNESLRKIRSISEKNMKEVAKLSIYRKYLLKSEARQINEENRNVRFGMFKPGSIIRYSKDNRPKKTRRQLIVLCHDENYLYGIDPLFKDLETELIRVNIDIKISKIGNIPANELKSILLRLRETKRRNPAKVNKLLSKELHNHMIMNNK